MMGRIGIIIAACLAASTAMAQEPGDSRRGRVLAERICAECHQLPGGGATRAASFEVIANTPGMTGLAISVWLRTPHREMPNLILDETQRADLTAYIVSLKR